MIVQEVILVDENDNQTGVMEKMAAHHKPNLHRAFSIFIFNDKGEILLQQRALDKYHSGGLWTNTCCSHPMPGEGTLVAAKRRLQEEMGFKTQLKKAFDFIYQVSFGNGLTEYEFDHVFIGQYDGIIIPDKNEVSEYCYKSMNWIKNSMASYPDLYTEWFKIALPKLEAFIGLK